MFKKCYALLSMVVFVDVSVIVFVCPVTALFIKSTDAQGDGVGPTDVTAFKGQQVTFNCRGTQVSWFKETQKIFTSPNIWGPELQGNKYDIDGQYNLVVKNLEASSDGGTYQCDTDENPRYLIEADLVVLGNILVKFLCALQL